MRMTLVDDIPTQLLLPAVWQPSFQVNLHVRIRVECPGADVGGAARRGPVGFPSLPSSWVVGGAARPDVPGEGGRGFVKPTRGRGDARDALE